MDQSQNSPNNNHIYNRRSHLQPATSNNNPYINYQQANIYDSTCFDSFEHSNYSNMLTLKNKTNKIRNSYPEENLKISSMIPDKNQSYSNFSNKLGVISLLINDIQKELENVTNSNYSITAEIVKLESSHSDLIANRISLVEEVIEKKTNLILLKKEVEVKKAYLNSLMRIKRTQVEVIHKTKVDQLNIQIDNINESTEILNEAASQLKNAHGLNLKFLDELNKEALINLIRKS
jgi:hypothetical protein